MFTTWSLTKKSLFSASGVNHHPLRKVSGSVNLLNPAGFTVLLITGTVCGLTQSFECLLILFQWNSKMKYPHSLKDSSLTVVRQLYYWFVFYNRLQDCNIIPMYEEAQVCFPYTHISMYFSCFLLSIFFFLMLFCVDAQNWAEMQLFNNI